VLNALRQSEENHSLYHKTDTVLTSCSTPYGNQRKITSQALPKHPKWRASAQRLTAIRGKSLSENTAIGYCRLVLNALRQSEENHMVITRSVTITLELRAQRLTAIRGKSLGVLSSQLAPGLMCSTPYGNQRKITS